MWCMTSLASLCSIEVHGPGHSTNSSKRSREGPMHYIPRLSPWSNMLTVPHLVWWTSNQLIVLNVWLYHSCFWAMYSLEAHWFLGSDAVANATTWYVSLPTHITSSFASAHASSQSPQHNVKLMSESRLWPHLLSYALRGQYDHAWLDLPDFGETRW